MLKLSLRSLSQKARIYFSFISSTESSVKERDKRSRPKVKLPSKREECTRGQCPQSFFVKAEKAEAEKIFPEKWQSVLRAHGRWIFSVVTRAVRCERATFLIADFEGFVVHPFPDLKPSLPSSLRALFK